MDKEQRLIELIGGGISLNARFNRYNYIFGENITLDKFKWLMEQIKQINIK